MPDTPKSDLSEHEEEEVPFDDVLRTLLSAKPATKPRLRQNQKPSDRREP